MIVTDFGCWWQNHYVGDFFRYVGDFLNILNRSPTSQTCHQDIWSPTSMLPSRAVLYVGKGQLKVQCYRPQCNPQIFLWELNDNYQFISY